MGRVAGRRGLVALLVVLAGSSPSHADYEETERRMKLAGVEPELRERIHRAIDRGVSFLLSRQDAAGCWPQREEGSYEETGIAALCALALRHAGTARAKSGFDGAMEFLALEDGGARRRGLEYVYTAGIVNMILMADRGLPVVARDLTDGIARAQDPESRWWGYFVPTKYTAVRFPRGGRPGGDFVNLSTSQFAALGLWAGGRLGARVDADVWRLHLESLVATQIDNGSWSYFPRRRAGRIVDGRGINVDNGYPTGTFMGLANLLLAEGALGDELKRDPLLAVRAKAARWRALEALDRDGPRALAEVRERGWIDLDTFYSLYALEKACIFAGRREVGRTPWYRVGAEWLCDVQREDGRWTDPEGGFATGPDIDTAFALLFLLRGSEAYTPRGPRPVDSAETTPGAAGPAPPSRAPLRDAPPGPAPIGVELSAARAFLVGLRSRIEDREATNDDIVASLRSVDVACRGLTPDEGASRDAEFAAAAATWRAEAHRLALAAVALERVNSAAPRNERLPVNLAAVRILAAWEPAVSAGLVDAFERTVFRASAYVVDPSLYDTGFAALAVLNRPEAFDWLAREVVSLENSEDAKARTRAALLALAAFEGVPGPSRVAAVKRLVERFGPVEESRQPHHRRLMDDVGGPLLAALRQLCRDTATGRPASIGSDEVRTLAEFRVWRARHADPDLPPWR